MDNYLFYGVAFLLDFKRLIQVGLKTCLSYSKNNKTYLKQAE